jgi:hypothetical protein
MESAISRQWYQLYENNPKIQAFAIIKGGDVVWQTSNWNLVEDTKTIIDAAMKGLDKISVGGITYKCMTSNQDSLIGSAGDKGHLLVVKINDQSWAVAWAESKAVPELAMIDLKKSAVYLSGVV